MATVDEILTRQAYAAGDGAWTKDNNYPSYTLYVEPEYVPVTNKRIADFNDQVSVRGERNAQFVGFQMPRYDDGLDLTAAHLYIHYQTVYGGSDSIPCNGVLVGQPRQDVLAGTGPGHAGAGPGTDDDICDRHQQCRGARDLEDPPHILHHP